MSWINSVVKHQRDWWYDGPPEARNLPWCADNDHPNKRARSDLSVCQNNDYSTLAESTQLGIKRPPSPVLSCPGVNSVTSEKDLTREQRNFFTFEVKKRTRELDTEEKPISTEQQHSADEYSDIKDLFTHWPLIDLFPEPIRCEDFDFNRCLHECLPQRDARRWFAPKKKLEYGPVLNGSELNPGIQHAPKDQPVYVPVWNDRKVNPYKWVNPVLYRRHQPRWLAPKDRPAYGPVLNERKVNPYKWVNPRLNTDTLY